MSANLQSAFEMALRLQERSVTFHQISTDREVSLKMAPSNYFRNYNLPEEIVTEGREWVMSKSEFDNAGLTGEPRRGDKVVDSVFEVGTVREVRQLSAGGVVLGFRIRVE